MTTGKEKQSGEDFPSLDMRLRVAYEFYKEFLVPFMAKGEGLTADRLTQLISQFEEKYGKRAEFSYADLKLLSAGAVIMAIVTMRHPSDAETAMEHLKNAKCILKLIEGAKPETDK